MFHLVVEIAYCTTRTLDENRCFIDNFAVFSCICVKRVVAYS